MKATLAILMAVFVVTSVFATAAYADRGRGKGLQLEDREDINFQTIEKGFTSGWKTRDYLIIKDSNTWNTIWNKVKVVPTALPSVDFSDEMVIAVFMGEKNTGGFEIKIKKIIETETKIIVEVKEEIPEPDSPVLQVLTQPFHIVKTKFSNKTIEFVTETEMEKPRAIPVIVKIDGKKIFKVVTEIDDEIETINLTIPVRIVIKQRGDEFVIFDGNITATINVSVELDGKKLFITDNKSKVQVKVLPSTASERAREALLSHKIKNITLEIVDKKPVYIVVSEQDGRLLGFIPIKLKAKTHVSGETGNLVLVLKPWWSFLVLPAQTNN